MENLPPLHDLEGYEADLAHVRWPTFCDGWNADKQAFYYQMLGEANTFICRCGERGSIHILGVDGINNCMRAMCKCRLNRIFEQIREKMRTAITRVDAQDSFLSAADGWGFLEFVVPPFLERYIVETPKLMVYSMEKRKVMIVHVTVRWESRLDNPNPEPTYGGTVQNLRMNGFSVEIRNIEIGCRGVYCPTLYQLFHEDFQMGDEEVEVTMMNISKGILSCPYEHHRLQN